MIGYLPYYLPISFIQRQFDKVFAEIASYRRGHATARVRSESKG